MRRLTQEPGFIRIVRGSLLEPPARLKPLSWLILHLLDKTQAQIDMLHFCVERL
jgi:hypothetical protein